MYSRTIAVVVGFIDANAVLDEADDERNVRSSRACACSRLGGDLYRDQRGLGAEADIATDPSLWCHVTKDSYLSCARP